MNALASWAEHLARALLQEPLPRRWARVQGVAGRVRSLAPVLGADTDLLEAAAWLHDIGCAPGLAATGLHALVAHHSYSIVEAGEPGLAGVPNLEFEPAPYALASMLTCCDKTTS